jgi:hypothetical protein
MRVDIYGSPPAGSAGFLRTLRAQCRRLGLSLRTTGSGNSPALVTIVFAGQSSAWTAQENSKFKRLASEEAIVLPVIANAPAARHIPPPLKKYNAFLMSSWDNRWPTGLTDEVLSIAWTRRRERKIFISYKRSDSQVIANQLYEALTRHQYLCFLDDISIGKGTYFQNELKWWLNDTDVLLVLLSPNFPASEWCMEEITFAQSRSIGLVAIDWPDSIYRKDNPLPFPDVDPGRSRRPEVLKAVDPDQRLKLDDDDFDGTISGAIWEQPLMKSSVLHILETCAQQRSICIRQRIEDLVPLAKEALSARQKFKAGKGLGDFTFEDAAGLRCFVRVLPFRPDATSIWDAYQVGSGCDIAGCFYSEYAKADIRADALRWLANRPHGTGANATRIQIWACVGDEIIKELP